MYDAANIVAELKKRAAAVESFLGICLRDRATPPNLRDAMEYSLLAGGKRLRPVLCLVTAELFGVENQKAMPFAAALEMIHTYSLIHDDLPCMDNDDLRRGKPTCHKAYDEATALLAGDALLTDAFHFMTDCAKNIASDRVLAAIRETAAATGSAGMVGGQVLDIEGTGSGLLNLESLQKMYALKTGALIKTSCLAGALLGGADSQALPAIERYGVQLGLAFQIVDDILDVVGDAKTMGKNPGGDAALGKTTYPSLLGLDESRRLAEEASQNAVIALGGFTGPQADFLAGLARMMVSRVS